MKASSYIGSSTSSRAGEVVLRSKNKIQSIMVEVLENAPKIMKYFLPFFELVFLCMFVTLSVDSSFSYNQETKRILGYSQLLSNPFSTELNKFSLFVHLTRAIFLFLLISFDVMFMFVFFREDNIKTISCILYVGTKVFGLVLFFPMFRAFGSVFRVNFKTSNEAVLNYDFLGYENTIQMIIFIPALINLCIIAIVNVLFLYKRMFSFTYTIEGRFSTFRLILVSFEILLTEILSTNESVRIILPCVNIIICFILLTVHIRFLPYLSKVWNVVVPLFYGAGICFSVWTLWSEVFPSQHWPTLSLLLLIFALPIIFIVMMTRICVILILYKPPRRKRLPSSRSSKYRTGSYKEDNNNNINNNGMIKRTCFLFVCDSYDFAIISHFTNRYDDFNKSVEHYFPNSRRAHLYFISLVLENDHSYVYKCATIMNKIQKYTRKSRLDEVQIDLIFRQLKSLKKIRKLQESGLRSSSLFDQEMKAVVKMETSLRSYLKIFWRGLLANEESNIEFGSYPTLVSKIESKISDLDSKYEHLLKKYHDDTNFLKKYGMFKCQTVNDGMTGKLFLDLAENRMRQDYNKEEEQEDDEDEDEDEDSRQDEEIPQIVVSDKSSSGGSHNNEEEEHEEGGEELEEEETSDDDDDDENMKNEAKINLLQTSSIPQFETNHVRLSDAEQSENLLEIISPNSSMSNSGYNSHNSSYNNIIKNEDEDEDEVGKYQEPKEEYINIQENDQHNGMSRDSNNNTSQPEEPRKFQVGKNMSQRRASFAYSCPSRMSLGGISDTGTTSHHNITSYLLRRIRKTNYLSVHCLRFLNCITFLFLLLITSFLISMYFVMESHFLQKENVMKDVARIAMDVSTTRHLLRKIDVADEEKTIFLYDTHRENFEIMLRDTISRIESEFLEAYVGTGSGKKYLWSEVKVSFDHFVTALNSSHVHTNTLIDSLTIFSERTENVLKLPLNATLRENSDFTYVLLTENAIIDALGEFKTLFLADNDLIMYIYFYALFTMIVLGFLILMMYCMLYCWMRCQFRVLVKSFGLIPKECVIKMVESFSQDKGNIMYNSISKTNSILERFYVRVIVFVLASIAIFCVIDGLSILVCNSLSQRNNEVILSSQLIGSIREVDSLAIELLYRDTSMNPPHVTLGKLHDGISQLKIKYETLRFGGEGIGESDSRFYSTFHAHACDVGIVVDEEITSLNNNNNITLSSLDTRIRELTCNSLNWLFNLYLQYAHMMELYYETLTLDHPWYVDFTLLDLYGGNDGVLITRLQGLTEKYRSYNQEMMDVLKVIFLTVLFSSVPAIFIIMCCILCPFPGRIRNTFDRVKLLFLSIPSEDLLRNKYLLEFLRSSTKNSVSSSNRWIQKFFRKKSRAMTIEVYDSYDNSSLLFFVLDSRGRVLRFNKNAGKIFNLKDDELRVRRFTDFVAERDLVKLRDFIMSDTKSFHGEITMSSYTHHFPAYIDVFQTKEKYQVLIRNLEEQRREENEKLRRQKAEDIGRLVKCVIPRQIFENLDVADQTAEYIFNNLSKEYSGNYKECTPIFSDICNFTGFSAQQSPERLIRVLNVIYSKFDEICEETRLEKIKTIGDCYFAIAGVPTYEEKHALLAAECGMAQLGWMELFRKKTGVDIHLRVGMSSGPVVSGILGRLKLNFDVFGDTVNCAARMGDKSLVDKIQVSKMTYDHLRDKYNFFERMLDLQGKGVMKAFILLDRKKGTKELYRVDQKEEIVLELSCSRVGMGDEDRSFDAVNMMQKAIIESEKKEKEV